MLAFGIHTWRNVHAWHAMWHWQRGTTVGALWVLGPSCVVSPRSAVARAVRVAEARQRERRGVEGLGHRSS